MLKRFVSVTVAAVALAFVFVVVVPATLGSQGTTKPDSISKKETGRGGPTDSNVKNDSGVNEKGKPSGAPSPGVKKGETSRQALCAVTFDNWTDLYVKTYVDGRYTGTMRPWGELYTYAVAGATVLYARADYTNGTYDYWGPKNVSCTTRYTWQLTD